ncbi:hypothetical protein POX_a01049 [Penicillium oxalicum]|uniref:hypothetical protein n=1 Tax=Penicillium oxalicum TaxID=69781 RepID=UPI0020B6E36F|nr:hypothetical protein POX_a01049 [Penicillium oxalicum]KAI2794450.1 hypothetical protein POX_a01049 [Penicillium oxalicum]
MSNTVSPVEQGRETSLPSRSATVHSTMTRQTTASDDDLIPDQDSNETTSVLLERLQAWKHMCGNLEEYVSATAKMAKSQSKDYEKVLKAVNEPLREGDHFSTGEGGINTLFETIRNQSQTTINSYLETDKNLRGTVLPVLERLHKEIKNKSKELKSGTSTGSKAVEKARQATQKHIELLGQHAAALDAGGNSKTDTQHDPYVLRRGINHRLHKQVAEENNHRNDIISIQNSFARFETHVLQTIQSALDHFFQIMGGQLDRQRSSYADILGAAQRIPPEFEWVNFCMNNESKLVNAESPLRTAESIQYPNMDHRTTQPLIEGSLERRSRAMLKGYNTGYYVVTPAGFLHEFKDNDDVRKEPSPELSLYLPDCVVGAVDGVKFNVKVSSDAEKWWTVLSDCAKRSPGQAHAAPVAAAAAAPAAAPATAAITTETPAATTPAAAAATTPVAAAATPVTETTHARPGETAIQSTPGASESQPPVYSEKGSAPAAEAAVPGAPPANLNRSASSGSHFHGGPGGSAV